MQFLGLDVLEVVSVRESITKRTANGVQRATRYARLKLEASEVNVQVADGIEIPEGYSGKAICDVRTVNYVTQFKNSAPSTQFAFSPTMITKFVPLAPVVKENAYDAFFSSAPRASGHSEGMGNKTTK